MLNIFYGRECIDKEKFIYEKINGRALIIVPDQYTCLLYTSVESFDETMQQLTDEQLRGKTEEFRERIKNGESLDDLLPEAFAVCREAVSYTHL